MDFAAEWKVNMIRIGLEFDDSGFNNLNLSIPGMGNPGIGGTEYEFLLLAYYLQITYQNYEVLMYHVSENQLPASVTDRQIGQMGDIIREAATDRIDLLICNVKKKSSFYKELITYKVNTIIWVHNYPLYRELKCIRKNTFVKRVVFVGKEQYDAYIADDVIEKATFIYNMVRCDMHTVPENTMRSEVTYVGSMIKEKGFHVLAKQWKHIHKVLPEARLNVIGSGKLYTREAVLGPYGIANTKYEKSFIKYITDEKGVLLDSITFWGLVGQNKQDIFRNTAVGVVNPTAISETFCISAAEMEACKIPICTKGKWGLYDSVINHRTGLYSKTGYGLRKNIIRLLSDRRMNEEYGITAKNYSNRFQPEEVIQEWDKTIREVYDNKQPDYLAPYANYWSDFKLIRMALRYLRFNMGLRFIPSFLLIEDILQNPETFIKNLIKAVINQKGKGISGVGTWNYFMKAQRKKLL